MAFPTLERHLGRANVLPLEAKDVRCPAQAAWEWPTLQGWLSGGCQAPTSQKPVAAKLQAPGAQYGVHWNFELELTRTLGAPTSGCRRRLVADGLC